MKPTSVYLLTIKILTTRSNQLIGFGIISERIVLIIQRLNIKNKLKSRGQASLFFVDEEADEEATLAAKLSAVRRLREAAAKSARVAPARVTMGHFNVYG